MFLFSKLPVTQISNCSKRIRSFSFTSITKPFQASPVSFPKAWRSRSLSESLTRPSSPALSTRSLSPTRIINPQEKSLVDNCKKFYPDKPRPSSPQQCRTYTTMSRNNYPVRYKTGCKYRRYSNFMKDLCDKFKKFGKKKPSQEPTPNMKMKIETGSGLSSRTRLDSQPVRFVKQKRITPKKLIDGSKKPFVLKLVKIKKKDCMKQPKSPENCEPVEEKKDLSEAAMSISELTKQAESRIYDKPSLKQCEPFKGIEPRGEKLWKSESEHKPKKSEDILTLTELAKQSQALTKSDPCKEKDPCSKPSPKPDPCKKPVPKPCKKADPCAKPPPCKKPDPCAKPCPKPNPCKKPDPCLRPEPKPAPCCCKPCPCPCPKPDPCPKPAPCCNPCPCPCPKPNPCKKPDPCLRPDPCPQPAPCCCTPCPCPCPKPDPCPKPAPCCKPCPCPKPNPCKKPDPCLRPDPQPAPCCKPCPCPCPKPAPCCKPCPCPSPCPKPNPCKRPDLCRRPDPCPKPAPCCTPCPCPCPKPAPCCTPCPCPKPDPCPKPAPCCKPCPCPCPKPAPCPCPKPDPCKKAASPCPCPKPPPCPCPKPDPCKKPDPCLRPDPCPKPDPCKKAAAPCPCPKPPPCPCPKPDPCKKAAAPCPKPDPCKKPDPCLRPDPCPKPNPCKKAAPCPKPKPCKKPDPCLRPDPPCPKPKPCKKASPCEKPDPCKKPPPCPKPDPCKKRDPCPKPDPCKKAPSCPKPDPCKKAKKKKRKTGKPRCKPPKSICKKKKATVVCKKPKVKCCPKFPFRCPADCGKPKPPCPDPCSKPKPPCPKPDPCKKPSCPKPDPCKKPSCPKPDPCKKPSCPKPDPCKKPSCPKPDPCKKPSCPKPDPCKKPSCPKPDPCKKPSCPKPDPCKKPSCPKPDSCKKADPCKKPSTPKICGSSKNNPNNPCEPKPKPCKPSCLPKPKPCCKKPDPCKDKSKGDKPCGAPRGKPKKPKKPSCDPCKPLTKSKSSSACPKSNPCDSTSKRKLSYYRFPTRCASEPVIITYQCKNVDPTDMDRFKSCGYIGVPLLNQYDVITQPRVLLPRINCIEIPLKDPEIKNEHKDPGIQIAKMDPGETQSKIDSTDPEKAITEDPALKKDDVLARKRGRRGLEDGPPIGCYIKPCPCNIKPPTPKKKEIPKEPCKIVKPCATDCQKSKKEEEKLKAAEALTCKASCVPRTPKAGPCLSKPSLEVQENKCQPEKIKCMSEVPSESGKKEGCDKACSVPSGKCGVVPPEACGVCEKSKVYKENPELIEKKIKCVAKKCCKEQNCPPTPPPPNCCKPYIKRERLPPCCGKPEKIGPCLKEPKPIPEPVYPKGVCGKKPCKQKKCKKKKITVCTISPPKPIIKPDPKKCKSKIKMPKSAKKTCDKQKEKENKTEKFVPPPKHTEWEAVQIKTIDGIIGKRKPEETCKQTVCEKSKPKVKNNPMDMIKKCAAFCSKVIIRRRKRPSPRLDKKLPKSKKLPNGFVEGSKGLVKSIRDAVCPGKKTKTGNKKAEGVSAGPSCASFSNPFGHEQSLAGRSDDGNKYSSNNLWSLLAKLYHAEKTKKKQCLKISYKCNKVVWYKK